MESPVGQGRYRVVKSEAYLNDWRLGCRDGWINPNADHVTLQYIEDALSRRPWAGPRLPGMPANVRVWSFPRSAVHKRGLVNLLYAVIEDDLVVEMQRLWPVSAS